MITKLRRKTLTLLAPVALLSCAAPAVYNSQTGQVNIDSASPAIQQQGAQAFEQYKRTKRISNNSSARARVYRVANRLQRVVPIPGSRWDFEVFEDNSANAFALPGGHVGINTGLLRVAQTDDQLAAVVAHEMAHVTSNHAERRLQTTNTINTIGSIAAQVLTRGQGGNPNLERAAGLATVALGRSFSRSQELQADKVGMLFMAKAGYQPEGAIQLWQNMAQASGSARVPEFLSTHPVSSTRIRELQAFRPEAKRAQR